MKPQRDGRAPITELVDSLKFDLENNTNPFCQSSFSCRVETRKDLKLVLQIHARRRVSDERAMELAKDQRVYVNNSDTADTKRDNWALFSAFILVKKKETSSHPESNDLGEQRKSYCTFCADIWFRRIHQDEPFDEYDDLPLDKTDVPPLDKPPNVSRIARGKR